MDIDAEDRIATIRGNFAVKCAGKPPLTIMEAAAGLHVPAPRTAEDLKALKALCWNWGIRVNIENDPIWKDIP